MNLFIITFKARLTDEFTYVQILSALNEKDAVSRFRSSPAQKFDFICQIEEVDPTDLQNGYSPIAGGQYTECAK